MSFAILVLGWLAYYGMGDRVPHLGGVGQFALLVACFITASLEFSKVKAAEETARPMAKLQVHTGDKRSLLKK